MNGLPMTSPSHPPTAADAAPGRSCPLHYRYRPEALATAAPPALQALDVLYVVGGLYGNELALQQVLALFERERGRRQLVFNGDFHWFDADPGTFDRVQRHVLQHTALRGNVETELAEEPAPGGAADAGCGCAYPAWVGDDVVARSNRILGRLRQATTAPQRAQLRRLPMWQRADVGDSRVAIVHGDAESLAGWGFAQEHLRDPAHLQRVRGWFDAAGVEAFACTHTCLPVFQAVPAHGGRGAPRWVLNNGAAGMPNFAGDGAGLLTRIALTPFPGTERRFGMRRGSVHIDAIAIATDAAESQRRFVAQWPAGSDAHASYFNRITRGPAYVPAEALRTIHTED